MRYALSSCLAAAVAFLSLAAPASAQDAERLYSADEVSRFADILVEAASIESARIHEAAAAGSDAEAVLVHETAERDLIQTIEASGLPVETFDEMVVQVQTDIRLSMQVTDELERRGAIPADFQGEDAMADATFGSGAVLTRRALNGEAGF